MSRIALGLPGRKPREKSPLFQALWLAAALAVPAIGLAPSSARAEDDYSMKESKDPPPESPGHWKTCAEAKSPQELMVHVDGLKDDDGNVRVQLYDDKPDHFLAKGWKLYRRDVPITGDSLVVCVPVPKPGMYALVVIHDENKNGKFDVFSEGFGFSNNPKIHFSSPDYEEAAFEVKPGVTTLNVEMKYVFGGRQKRARRGGKY